MWCKCWWHTYLLLLYQTVEASEKALVASGKAPRRIIFTFCNLPGYTSLIQKLTNFPNALTGIIFQYYYFFPILFNKWTRDENLIFEANAGEMLCWCLCPPTSLVCSTLRTVVVNFFVLRRVSFNCRRLLRFLQFNTKHLYL